MTSVADARALMLATVSTLGVESVSLNEAFGRTLAAPIIASRDQPPFAASAMDGFALRAVNTPGDLRIVGESAAGRAFVDVVGPGQAVRISTGAQVPGGADSILIQEDALVRGDRLTAGRVAPGRHIRAAGGDFERGDALLEAGAVLHAVDVALIAACGAASVRVARRPRVAILSGGDEIVAPGAIARPDQIYDSCSYGVEALAVNCGAVVHQYRLLPDEPDAIEAAAREAADKSDFLVFIGAASVGPHDHARGVVEKLGGHILVKKIDMRPGKPTWFAATPGPPVLGLPGNPASAFVSGALFLAPVLAKLQGAETASRVSRARLAHALPANGPREAYLRARMWTDDTGQMLIDASADQDSSLLSVFARSNALLVRPAGAPAGTPSDIVEAIAWPPRG